MIFNPVIGGESAELGTKTITQNGTYSAASDNLDGYSEVTANVPNTYAAADEGKVVSNGALVAQTSRSVTANGTYDTTLNNEVVVNVPGSSPTLITKSITANGTYDAEDDNADGYSSVTVDVPSGESYTVMSQAQWDALTRAQKQSYGLVLIGDSTTVNGPYWFGNRMPSIVYALFDHEHGDIQTNLTASSATHGYNITESLSDLGLLERTYEMVLTMRTGRGYGLHMISLGGTNAAGGSIYFDSTMFGWWANRSDRFRVTGLSHSIQTDQKYHAAVVVKRIDNTLTFKLYFNGSLVASKEGVTYVSDATYSATSFSILYNQSNANTDYYTGTFYQFAVTNEALSPSEFVLSA